MAGVSLHWNLSANMDMEEEMHLVTGIFGHLFLVIHTKIEKKSWMLLAASQPVYLDEIVTSSVWSIIKNNQVWFWHVFLVLCVCWLSALVFDMSH